MGNNNTPTRTRLIVIINYRTSLFPPTSVAPALVIYVVEGCQTFLQTVIGI